MKNKILIDTDIGSDVDDLFALIFALRRTEFLVKGISTVGSDSLLRAKIVKNVLNLLNKNINVCAGMNSSQEGGKFWWCGLEPKYLENLPEKRPFRIKRDLIKFYKERSDTILVALGPLTNIAHVLKSIPFFKLRKIYWMGSSINLTIKEHNLNSDIKAAKYVLASKIPLTIFPLDITLQFVIKKREIVNLWKKKNVIRKFLIRRLNEWLEFVSKYREKFPFKFPKDGTFLHDILPVAALVKPSYFEFEKVKVKIEKGKIKKFYRGKEVKICTRFKWKKVKQIFLTTLSKI